jgi:hypothetical protein
MVDRLRQQRGMDAIQLRAARDAAPGRRCQCDLRATPSA